MRARIAASIVVGCLLPLSSWGMEPEKIGGAATAGAEDRGPPGEEQVRRGE